MHIWYLRVHFWYFGGAKEGFCCFQPFVADKFQGPNFMESWYSFLEEGGGGVDSNRLPRNCSDSSPRMPNSIREHEISWESLYLYYKISRSSQKIDGRVLVASHQEDDTRTNFREAESDLKWHQSVGSESWRQIVAVRCTFKTSFPVIHALILFQLFSLERVPAVPVN